MNKDEKQTILRNMMSVIKDSSWTKELKEGFISIPKIWQDVTESYDNLDLEQNYHTSLLNDFYAMDDILIKEIEETILKFLKREIFNSINLNSDKIEKIV